MDRRDKSCSIFVGNVPYDADEEELKDLFGKAGVVSSVRVVCDRETRQPKGYAFCDFADRASVENAIDKLNNVEYNGRQLRVDFAERELGRQRALGDAEGGDKGHGRGRGPVSGPVPQPIDPVPVAMPVTTVADRLARIREHEAAEQARIAAFETAELTELARFVETLTPQQLFHILGEMQRLSIRAPDVARALVTENTQLCLALQHAQFLLGLAEEAPLPTDPEVRERARNVKEKVFGVAPMEGVVGSAMPGMPPLPPMGPQFGTAPGLLGFGGLPPGFPAGAAMGQLGAFAAALGQLGAAGGLTGPVGMPSMPVPSMPIGIPAAAGAPAGDKPSQELLDKLSKLSPEQIDQLPHQTKIALLGFLQGLPAQA